MNESTNTIVSENIILSPQQTGTVGSFPIYVFPGLVMPTMEDIFRKKTEELEAERELPADDKTILELGKKYFEANKKGLLKKYQNKYIAILNNKVVGSDKDFSRLAERVYKKFGYQTIYMPFVSEQKRTVKIPSPRISNL
jgi:cyclopropane fatty-acyl-phospholipid synthase-like methyltransferase